MRESIQRDLKESITLSVVGHSPRIGYLGSWSIPDAAGITWMGSIEAPLRLLLAENFSAISHKSDQPEACQSWRRKKSPPFTMVARRSEIQNYLKVKSGIYNSVSSSPTSVSMGFCTLSRPWTIMPSNSSSFRSYSEHP